MTDGTTRPRPPLAAVLGVALAVAVLVVAVVLLVADGDDEPERRLGVPSEVSAEQLRDFAEEEDRPVYWAGEISGTKLELTETSRGYVYVRYLPDLAPIGDDKPNYTTVATYPQRGAFAAARRAARRRGNVSRDVPGGGVAVWSRSRPRSVYLAFPEANYLIEVFHPRATEARELALSGQIQRIS